MKRYHYRPVDHERPTRQRVWLIPVAIVSIVAAVVAVASIGAVGGSATASQTRAKPASTEVPAVERIDGAAVPESSSSQSVVQQFKHCGVIRRTCVVDGDTFWLEGNKIRVADIDTPEVSKPQCASEKALGDRATNRLVELLNAGPFELSPIGSRDEDQYGRKLRVVTRNGKSLGDQLVSEGLARTWTGRREPWC